MSGGFAVSSGITEEDLLELPAGSIFDADGDTGISLEISYGSDEDQLRMIAGGTVYGYLDATEFNLDMIDLRLTDPSQTQDLIFTWTGATPTITRSGTGGSLLFMPGKANPQIVMGDNSTTGAGFLDVDNGRPLNINVLNDGDVNFGDGEITFNGHPATRDDGAPPANKVFYPGPSGELLVGTVAGGTGTPSEMPTFSSDFGVFAIPDTTADVTLQTTLVENDTAVLEGLAAAVDIKEAGLYWLYFETDIDAPNNDSTYNVDGHWEHSVSGGVTGTFVDIGVFSDPSIPGSDVPARLSSGVAVDLPVGTLSLQLGKTLLAGASSTINTAGGTISVVKLTGQKGDKGDAGSGSTVTVNGSTVDTVDFDTDDFDVNVAGSVATVTAKKPFKKHIALAAPAGVNQNNSGWVQALRLSAGIPRAGTYKLSWSYTWSVDNSTGSDFRSRIQQDDVTDIMEQRQEPKDVGGTGQIVTDLQGGTFNSGTDQRHVAAGFDIVTLTAATHNWDLDIQDDAGGTDEPVLYRAVLTIEEWIE